MTATLSVGTPATTPERVLDTVTELARRWHAHDADNNEWRRGMCNGYAQSIALLLGATFNEVLVALRSGAL